MDMGLIISLILIFSILIYFLYRIISSVVRINRVKDFALINDKKFDDTFGMNIVYHLTDGLEYIKIFNWYGKKYNKYVNGNNRIRKGMDYVSIKILLGILFFVLYFVLIAIYNDDINVLAIICSFILGFILPDFYCIFNKRKVTKISNKQLLEAIIIMNNSFKANRSTEQAIRDVVKRSNGLVKDEFKRILDDVKMGLSLGDAFFRMYNRTKLNNVLYISHVFKLSNKAGINIVDIFDSLEKKIVKEEKFNNEVIDLININKISLVIFSILPGLFILIYLSSNIEYFKLFVSNVGVIIVLIISIIYILYLFIINRIVRRY
jgi:tight adherence protein B